MTLKRGMSGEEVKNLQQRLTELGYLNDKIDGKFGPKTEDAVLAFQADAGLVVDGLAGSKTMAALNKTNAPHKSATSDSNISSATPAKGTAKKMDWWKSDIQKIFAKGVTATITDVATGIAWREQRRGGTNHADLQPCTAADTAAFKKACKKWSWERRAVFVTINGINYAASINCQPHGGSSIKNNNFDGHHCCHFTNSRTHCSNKVCPNHKKAIEKAASTTL